MTELVDRPATELAALLRAGEVSARELLAATLDRIAVVNPRINAIVTLAVEAAEAAAAAADDAHAAGRSLGPLHGLPLAVKDTHATAGLRTTQGSPVFAQHVPDADELVVARERAAGAVVVGKTNVPEFAAGSHTFNTVFGTTRNPYAPERSAGGSSGGAAATLATGMAALADGSDMGGSLRNPASFCNVVGHRPTPGRIPSFPNAQAFNTLSVQGPMGRTVADAALLFSVQAGPDPRSPLALDDPGTDFAGPLPERLDGLRIAFSTDLGGAVPVDPEVVAVLERQMATFEELGATVVVDCLDFTGADEVFRTLRALAFVDRLGPLVDEQPDLVKETIHWNVAQGRALTGAQVAATLGLQSRLWHRAREFFDDYTALVLPTSQVLPFDADLEYPTTVAGVPQHSYLDWMRSAYYVSALGCPATAVPAGFTPDGLPVGLQVVGAPRADRTTLSVAHAFEQATRVGEHRPPR